MFSEMPLAGGVVSLVATHGRDKLPAAALASMATPSRTRLANF
jgi:hypothetical protein